MLGKNSGKSSGKLLQNTLLAPHEGVWGVSPGLGVERRWFILNTYILKYIYATNYAVLIILLKFSLDI